MKAALTIFDLIKTVLPDGTRAPGGTWHEVCEWPPDLFAVVAAITERAGLYSEQRFMSYWTPGFVLTEDCAKHVREAGSAWADTATPPQLVEELWRQLFQNFREVRIENRSDVEGWKEVVLRLLVIADEACAGIGFAPRLPDKQPTGKESQGKIQHMFMEDHIAWVFKCAEAKESDRVVGGELLPYLPHSLCIRVPPAVLCVQPKTATPAVGCTLRSLTHHLALLPSWANVETHWYVAHKPDEDREAFNILVVPFPFSIPGKSFKPGDGHFPGIPNDRVFWIDPKVWLRSATPKKFADFLLRLVDAARDDVDTVHAIVLPEAALPTEFADNVAELLTGSGLDLFLTGVLDAGIEARNAAAIFRLLDKETVAKSLQSKHHRWRLDGSQIRRYQLGHVLDPHRNWWERICVSERNSYVMLFRSYASLAVLVCEDLARYDPVLTVMNAIGPNLVICLLMDGPQLEQRWPGRYATALAEDPGSAVLTVTSLGMVRRSTLPGEPENSEVALWKEPNGKAQPLRLKRGDHALLLSLSSKMVEQFTLDGRSDGCATVHFGLSAAYGIRDREPPEWLEPPQRPLRRPRAAANMRMERKR
jgi:hypothetical protein